MKELTKEEIKSELYAKIFNEDNQYQLNELGFKNDIFRLMDKCFENSDQNTKPLVEEIERYKKIVAQPDWNELEYVVGLENKVEKQTDEIELVNTINVKLNNTIIKLQSDLKAAESVNEWISVEDRLPELNKDLMGYEDDNVTRCVIIPNYFATVLGYDPIKGVIKCEYKKRGFSEVASFGSSSIVNIIKWMPLPTNPI